MRSHDRNVRESWTVRAGRSDKIPSSVERHCPGHVKEKLERDGDGDGAGDGDVLREVFKFQARVLGDAGRSPLFF